MQTIISIHIASATEQAAILAKVEAHIAGADPELVAAWKKVTDARALEARRMAKRKRK